MTVTAANPGQRYVDSILAGRSSITNFGELMIPLNVKYVLLTKEADYEGYLFLLNQTDLELEGETENFYVFKNRHDVSRFYLSSESPPFDIEPEFSASLAFLPASRVSPVAFEVEADDGYIIFVPPNLDSKYWEFDGEPSHQEGFYAAYPAGAGTVYYSALIRIWPVEALYSVINGILIQDTKKTVL